jgi:hypothetical protein
MSGPPLLTLYFLPAWIQSLFVFSCFWKTFHLMFLQPRHFCKLELVNTNAYWIDIIAEPGRASWACNVSNHGSQAQINDLLSSSWNLNNGLQNDVAGPSPKLMVIIACLHQPSLLTSFQLFPGSVESSFSPRSQTLLFFIAQTISLQGTWILVSKHLYPSTSS